MEYVDVRNKVQQTRFIIIALIIGILSFIIFYLLEMDNELEFIFGMLSIISLAASLGVFINYLKDNNRKKAIELSNYIKNKYQLDEVFISNDTNGILGINYENEVFYLLKKEEEMSDLVNNEMYTIETLPFNCIKQINIIENDSKITKSTKKDSLGKSVDGAFGKVNAYKGKVIRRIRVQVVTDNISNPTRDILIYNYGQGFKRNSEVDIKLYKVIDEWIDRLNLLINKTEQYI